MNIDRQELVRRLLGAGTQLFLDDSCPIAVHCLVSSALEHAEHLAEELSQEPLKAHIMATFPEMQKKDIKRLRNKSWTVIKHSHDFQGNPVNVSQRLESFSDSDNDGVLFAGWYDFMQCGRPIPIAAQVFQLWFFRIYPESLDHEKDFDFPIFDNLHLKSRLDQKALLREAIADAANLKQVIGDPKTDNRPLVLPLQ